MAWVVVGCVDGTAVDAMQRRVGKMLLGKLSLHVDVAADGLQAFEVAG